MLTQLKGKYEKNNITSQHIDVIGDVQQKQYHLFHICCFSCV